MFKIGEFSKIAQVSGRLLRYYDEIGLLHPVSIDEETGYRYYSATQLPRLNHILALKDLGLSLDQIARLLDDDISTEEIRGMLLMKKTQVEQALRDELTRLRHIESRLQLVETGGQIEGVDVVIKSVPAQKFLAVRQVCADMDDAFAHLSEITHLVPARVGEKPLGQFAAIVLSDFFETENIEVEMGYFLDEDIAPVNLTLSDGGTMTVREMPAIETMATAVRIGVLNESSHLCYSALGIWVEANGYRFNGQGREVFLQLPRHRQDTEAVVEIQFPVEKIIDATPLLA